MIQKEVPARSVCCTRSQSCLHRRNTDMPGDGEGAHVSSSCCFSPWKTRGTDRHPGVTHTLKIPQSTVDAPTCSCVSSSTTAPLSSCVILGWGKLAVVSLSLFPVSHPLCLSSVGSHGWNLSTHTHMTTMCAQDHQGAPSPHCPSPADRFHIHTNRHTRTQPHRSTARWGATVK